MSAAWLTYLSETPGELGKRARSLWAEIAGMHLAASGTDLPDPHAVIVDSKLSMDWDNGPRHFEVEISAASTNCAWFYLHRETDRIEGGEEGICALALGLLGETTEGMP